MPNDERFALGYSESHGCRHFGTTCGHTGEVPPSLANQGRVNDENVMTIFFVRAEQTANEIS
jgi:hypothetical protein